MESVVYSSVGVFMKVLCAVALLVVSFPVFSQSNSVSQSFPVRSSVQAACVIVGSENIPYGLYNPVTLSGAPEVLSQSKISVRCTAGTTNVKVLLSQGENASTSSSCIDPHRRLRSEKGDYIVYEIFQDENRSQVWGCAEGNQHSIPYFTSSIIPVQLNTYSRIPAGQNIAEGTYADMVDVSVMF